MSKKLINFLKTYTAFGSLFAIFDNDEYNIVSERGWWYLSDKKRLKKILKENEKRYSDKRN
jgi:phosphoglycerol transferase MdoB-like AlkP superfamily enzyme